jgi:hypothetical protein
MAYRRRPALGIALLVVLLTGSTSLPVLHDAVTAHGDHSSTESPSQVVTPCLVCDGHLASAIPSAADIATRERPLVIEPAAPETAQLHEPGYRARNRARAPPPSS